ncbi:unnamed protein product [Arabidopsis lyrata]|nr:unnamed protein product [Arabidopsis lyrata]
MSNPSNFRFTPPLYPQFTTKEPNMIHFMEETHLNKKTPTISDLKTKQTPTIRGS